MNPAEFKLFIPLLKASKDADGRMRLHGVASSTIRDRHGDTISLSALSEMEKSASNNMTIFLNHSYQVPEDVAGSVERAEIRATGDPDIHDLLFDIAINDVNPRAVSAWEAIQKGTQLGLSIGARIPTDGAVRQKDGRYQINHIDLLETSLVGVPANPRSWVEYAIKSLTAGGVTVHEEPEEVVLAGLPVTPVIPVDSGTIEDLAGIGKVADELMTDLEKAKKPATHEHPHAHTHVHEHEHWNGTVHSHEHAHTHAHEHGDDHQHVDDMQGSEHDHNHVGSFPEDHPHDEDSHKGDAPTLTGDELTAHLAAFRKAASPTPESGDGAAAAPQEAPSSNPENGDVPAVASETLSEPTFAGMLLSANASLISLTRELMDTKDALTKAEQERDKAVLLADKVMKDTSSLLNRLAEAPIGRKTVVTEQVAAFDSLKSVYSEAFLELLNKKEKI